MTAIKSKHIGVLSVVAVALMLAVCVSPMVFTEDSDAATGDGTIYLRPGDTYTWTPTFNIDASRVSLTVNASTSTTPGTFSSSSTAGGVTASVANKTVSISVADNTSASTVYVKVKATTTSGVSQTATATITVKVIVPTISFSDVSTYQGGSVNAVPTINGASIDGKTVTYTATGLPSGLSVNATNGKVTGTVSSSAQAKTYAVKVTGSIATDPTQTFSGSFNIVVASAMSLNAIGTQYTAQGTAKDISLTGTNTTSGTTWSITSSSVSGITMSTATGTSGKITVASSVAAGTYTIDYKAVNPTSGQQVSKSVTVVVGNVAINSVTATGGVGGTVSAGAITLYAVQGTAAEFTVSAASNPSAANLGLTLSKTGTNADKVALSGQKISTATTLAAGTYSFTLTETQASTGATASVSVTLIVDPVFDFSNSVTSGSLSVKGAGN